MPLAWASVATFCSQHNIHASRQDIKPDLPSVSHGTRQQQAGIITQVLPLLTVSAELHLTIKLGAHEHKTLLDLGPSAECLRQGSPHPGTEET